MPYGVLIKLVHGLTAKIFFTRDDLIDELNGSNFQLCFVFLCINDYERIQNTLKATDLYKVSI